MAIFRVNKTKDYTTMSNYHLKDKKISLRAKGFLSEMLSLPDDWGYSIEGLASLNLESSKSIKTILGELKNNHYLVIKKLMPNETESGRIEYIYDIYEIPKTRVPKQEGCFQEVEKQEVVFDRLLNTNIQNTNNISTSSPIEEKDIFQFIQENFGRTLAPIEYEEIKKWEDNELTRYAIKQAVLNGKYGIKYISKILYEYQKNNIKTVQQAQQREQDYQKQKQQSKQYKHHKTQREREEEAIAKFLSEPDD